MTGTRGRGDIATSTTSWRGPWTKRLYEGTLQDFQALHLEAAEQFDKINHHFASHVFLENGFSQFGITTNNAWK